MGPFLSGGLFSLATRVEPKGEAVAFGVFGGIAFIGFLLSFGIRSPKLEAEGWDREHGEDDEEDDDDDSKSGEEDESENEDQTETEARPARLEEGRSRASPYGARRS